MATSTTKSTDQVTGSTARKDTDSGSSPDEAGYAQDRTSTQSASYNKLKGFSMMTSTPPAPTKTDGSYSTQAQNEGSTTASTSGTGAGNFAITPSSRRPTEPVLGGGQSVTRPTVDDRQSTTRSSKDPEQHATAGTDDNISSGGSDGTTHTSATASAYDSSVNRNTKTPNAEGEESTPHQSTINPNESGSEHTTSTYEEYLKGIKLNLGLDFDLKDLTNEQKKNFEDLGKAYGLDPSKSQVLLDAYMKLALQIVAAKMSPQERQVVGFQLKDLVSSCIMNGEPCDLVNDFKQTFDVDYGNCFTFNHGTPVKYITKRAGSAYGLRMTVISNSSEALPASSEEGIKILVHNQDTAPFPNVEGYRSPIGQAVSLQLTR
ncbi:degenerin unc-8, partial [Aphelenchoides avenae]